MRGLSERAGRHTEGVVIDTSLFLYPEGMGLRRQNETKAVAARHCGGLFIGDEGKHRSFSLVWGRASSGLAVDETVQFRLKIEPPAANLDARRSLSFHLPHR